MLKGVCLTTNASICLSSRAFRSFPGKRPCFPTLLSPHVPLQFVFHAHETREPSTYCCCGSVVGWAPLGQPDTKLGGKVKNKWPVISNLSEEAQIQGLARIHTASLRSTITQSGFWVFDLLASVLLSLDPTRQISLKRQFACCLILCLSA